MLHNASLLIDDIEDNSKLRRGFPVAHSIYGIPSDINSANYMYFLGLEKVLTLDHPDAVKLFTRQLLDLHQGQGLDIYWRDNYTCPTEEEYRAMVLQKTGGLFGLAVGHMQLFSDYKEDLKPLLNTLGLFFQIRDDYANLHSKEYSENKSFCEDLTEGKRSPSPRPTSTADPKAQFSADPKLTHPDWRNSWQYLFSVNKKDPEWRIHLSLSQNLKTKGPLKPGAAEGHACQHMEETCLKLRPKRKAELIQLCAKPFTSPVK
nr:geranylgeranyl pyrophosphate synthase-like [Camelus dromedarius]